MEAWKFVDFTTLSPTFALGFTTPRWGLEQFPGNLVAIPGTWNKAVDEAWSLPYTCNSTNPTSYYDCTSSDGGCDYGDSSTTNISNSPICNKPVSCSNSNCLILIEGTDANTTGPAHSNIVGLAHGISALVTLLITTTIILIMGSCFSSTADEKPYESRTAKPDGDSTRPRLAPTNLPQYNPPKFLRAPKWAEQELMPSNKASDIAKCADLLRQMYAMDLVIWGTEHAVAGGQTERKLMMTRADCLYTEIRRMVYSFHHAPRSDWSHAERACVEDIFKAVERHGAARYSR